MKEEASEDGEEKRRKKHPNIPSTHNPELHVVDWLSVGRRCLIVVDIVVVVVDVIVSSSVSWMDYGVIMSVKCAHCLCLHFGKCISEFSTEIMAFGVVLCIRMFRFIFTPTVYLCWHTMYRICWQYCVCVFVHNPHTWCTVSLHRRQQERWVLNDALMLSQLFCR